MNDVMTGLAHDKGLSSSFEHDLCPERSLLPHAFQIYELSCVMNYALFIFYFTKLAYPPFEPSYYLLLLITDGGWQPID